MAAEIRDEREEPRRPLEVTPRPRVQRLSSAIVWIAAILAVAVLWIVGYLVTDRQAPRAEARRPSTLAQAADDLAAQIERAAERQERERAAFEATLRPRPSLPPGFESLLEEPEPVFAMDLPTAGLEPYPPPTSTAPAAAPVQTTLDRARDSDLVPQAFRGSSPRASAGAEADAEVDGDVRSPFVELAALREDFRDVARGLGPSDATAPRDEAPPGRGFAFAVDDDPRRVDARQPATPFTLLAGTLIPAVLTAAVDSDLPGPTSALVRRNVYDSLTGRHLLVPQGSRLLGEYDSRVALGQRRVLVAWHRLIFPDGRSVDLGGMPGADASAAAGLRDKVDRHFARTFGGALFLAAISAGVQLSQPSNDGGAFTTAPTPSQVAAAALGQEMGRVATEMTRQNLDVRPTLRVRPGYRFNVEVTADLAFGGAYRETRR